MRVMRRLSIVLLGLLVVGLGSMSSAPAPGFVAIEDAHELAASYPSAALLPTAIPIDEPERAVLDVLDQCDVLLVVQTPSGPQLTKRQPAWLGNAKARARHQAEQRLVIEVIAAELGVDEISTEMLVRKGILESSLNERSVHVRTQDIEANRRAARRGREASSERWARARVPVFENRRGKFVQVGTHNAWALGRGLYGMVTGLHLSRWGTDVPPWSLCDPVIATVTAIWAMRAGLAECRKTGLRDAYRRFSSGKCAVREPRLERGFDRLARGRVRGLKLPAFDADAPANFGSRWREETTDRAELLVQLRAKVAERRGKRPL